MSRRRWAGVLLAAVTLVMAGLTACGAGTSGANNGTSAAVPGGGAGAGGSSPSGGSGGGGSAAAGSTGGAADAPTPTVHGGGGGSQATIDATPGQTPLQYAPNTTPAAVTATLSSSCVRPGGSERLTITAHPGLEVAYDVQYSDGSDGGKNGGKGTGPVPSSGTYQSSWVVAAGAPTGTAVCYVSVAGGNQSAFRQPTFTVSGSC